MQFLRHFSAKFPVVWDTTKFGILFTGSEWTQQVLMRKIWNENLELRKANGREDLDWGSIFRYSVWGFAIFPHILRRWYRFIDTRFVGKTGWRVVAMKTTIDQTFFPIPILSSFYIFLSLLEGKTQSWSHLTEECKAKLSTTLKARYCFMVPAQVINFAFIAPKNRVIYIGVMTYFWLNILCIFKRLDMNNEIFK